jgi:hypothetical protein
VALYEYTLYVVREHARGDLLEDAISREIVSVQGNRESGDDVDGTCLGGRVRCSVSHGRVPASSALELLTILLDNQSFQRLLDQTPDDLIPWLWQIAETLDPACFFMPGGGDIKYFERGVRTDELTFKQLPRLVSDGEIAVVHPIMYFAERLGQGRLCTKAEGAPWSHVEHRPARGCLLVLAHRDATTGMMEIREPVALYDILRAYFD